MIDRPTDQTSEETVYVASWFRDSPLIRSGYRVMSDCNSGRREMTHSHVRLTTNVCLGERLFQLARNTEIAELDLSFLVDQYVGGLDICSSLSVEGAHDGPLTSVHDLQLILQEAQAPHNGRRDPPQYRLGHSYLGALLIRLDRLRRNPSSSQGIERSSIHILHTVVHARLDGEGTEELDDFRCDGSM